VTFYRTTQAEAENMPGLALTARLEGIPLYVHADLLDYFEVRPLILAARGPRLALERDAALAAFEAGLKRTIESGHHGQ
jgi:hypothetical protein